METQSDTNRQLVITKVADVLCGIEIDSVHEIIPTQEITSAIILPTPHRRPPPSPGRRTRPLCLAA